MGTAHVQGDLWSRQARDYASIVEGLFRPIYEAVFDATGLAVGTRLLDVGCGPGLAAHLASGRGAIVAGLDAAEASLRIARERTPEGDFRAGEMEELPWPAESFDVVTGFNAFQFAADPANALREARRVTRAAGQVAMVVWGRAEDCEIAATVAEVSKLLPPPPRGAGGPFALGIPGRVEALLEQAGLTPRASGEVDCVFAFTDCETAVRGLSSGMVVAAHRLGLEALGVAIAASLAPFQTSTGGYRQRNRLRYVIAST